MKWISMSLLYLSSLLVLLPVNATSETTSNQASMVKAALIYKFSKFVDWPEKDQNTPLILCTLGHDSLVEVFDERIAPLEKILVQPIDEQNPIEHCHILYIARSEQGTYRSRQSINKQLAVLTVSEMPGFVQAGGIIEFTYEHKKIRFDINLDVAHAVNLEISSSLLKLAREIKWSYKP